MLSSWSLCSRSLMCSSSVEELVLLKDINSTVVRLPTFVLDSEIVAEADVVPESVEDMFPSFKCMVPYNCPWRDGNHKTHTQWQGTAFKTYIYEIKRARSESMTTWNNRSDEALMDMRKKLATAPGANSSESTMIPPQFQGWLLLHRARWRDQDIVGAMTMTGASLNIKLVEKSLLDLFIDDVLQSVDGSHGKDTVNPRKQRAFEAVEEIPENDDDTYLKDDFSENDDPYIDEDGNFLANEQIVSDIGDDLALDVEEYHEALLGFREARDLIKEARAARGFYLVVVPIRSDKPTGRGKGDSSSVKNVSGKTGRGKGGRGSKGSGRPSDSRGRGRKGKGRGRSGARDGPSSSQVCFKCGSNDHWARDCPKMDDGSSNPKKRNLGAHAYGAWTCNNPDNSRDEKCSSDSFQVDYLCVAVVSLVQDDDECAAHAAFLKESEGLGVLDCGATTSFGSVEGAEALFSKSHEHDTRIPDVDPFGGRPFNFGRWSFVKECFLVQTPSPKSCSW